MQSTIYNHFSEDHGVVNDKKNLMSKMSKNELKRQLKVLKYRIPNPEEKIKHVSRILIKKFRKKRASENYDHHSDYYKNFLEILQKSFRTERKNS